MFSGLRERLQAARNRLGASIGAAAEASRPVPAEPSAPSTAAAPGKSPTLADKVKILIIDRELVVSEKDVAGALDELEMTLLKATLRCRLPMQSLQTSAPASWESTAGSGNRSIRSLSGPSSLPCSRSSAPALTSPRISGAASGRSRSSLPAVNGTGKTTTVAKIGAYLKKQGFSVVIGAGDTYRAGAIEQIGVHAERLGIKVIEHQTGADPSAVLFDTVQYAISHKIDVVLADTAAGSTPRRTL